MDTTMNQNFGPGKKVPTEGKLTKTVEKVTAQVPSIGYLTLAICSMAVSAGISLFGSPRRQPLANFIGLWVPTIMVAGLYNKLVKLEGSDAFDKPATVH
jgi:hypothetical protein